MKECILDKDYKNTIKKLFSSSNINVLLGSAFSLPILKTLADIEKKLNDAKKSNDKNMEFLIKKRFFW